MTNKVKSSQTAKLKNRRVSLVYLSDGVYLIKAKSLICDFDGIKRISRHDIKFTGEAMRGIVEMYIFAEMQEGRKHVFEYDDDGFMHRIYEKGV